MRAVDSWTAFLLMLFAIVGLCGLFASYAPLVPLERALARNAMLDELLQTGATPAQMEAMAPRLGSLVPLLRAEATPLPQRVMQARALVAEEGRREAASVVYRTRLMVGVVTLLSAALGCGILAMVRRPGPARPGADRA